MTGGVPAIVTGYFANVRLADKTNRNLYHFPRSSCLSSSHLPAGDNP